MTRRSALLAVCSFAAALAAQQDGAACRARFERCEYGVIVDGDAHYAAAGRALATTLPPGAWQLRFPPGGGGRPAPLALQVAAGDEVAVAVGAMPRADEVAVVHVAEPFTGARLFGDDELRDVRVRVRMRSTGGVCGLVGRVQDDQHCYRFVWDAPRAELRLERQLGDQAWALVRAKAPASGDGWHTLELQLQGFQVLALCDDVVVASEMDGALTHGRFGTYASTAAAGEFSQLEAGAPTVPVPTLAAVRSDGQVAVTARAPAQAGACYMLCLRLDRPVPLVPTTILGFEPFVLQRPALPVFVCGFAFGTVGARGEIEGQLAWPVAKLLRGQAALIGGLLGSPDAETAIGWLPWAGVRW